MVIWTWTFITLLHAACATKWHKGGPGFLDQDSYYFGNLPCYKDQVIFPENYLALLPIPPQVDINGFVLPLNGALLLSPDSSINLDEESNNISCNNKKNRAYIKSPKVSKWFDPHTWKISDSMLGDNSAVSELEHVPCNNEPVIVTRTKGPIAFDLQNIPFLRLGQLNLAGSSLSKEYFEQLINEDVGQFLFHNSANVHIEYYRNEDCGCLKDFNKYIGMVCHNAASCNEPRCFAPITPLGACCPICGAVLRFNLNQCNLQLAPTLKSLLTTKIAMNDLTDELDVHVAYLRSGEMGNFLQVTIVDHNEYKEKSVTFAHQFLESNESVVFDIKHQLDVHYAGHPYNPNKIFSFVLLILFCVTFVCIVSFITISRYAPHNPCVSRIQDWIDEREFWRAILMRSSFVFARFDNFNAGDSGVEESILAYHAESDEIRERAFNNPMFRGQLVSEESGTSAVTIKLENPTERKKLVEEQELTEINLESDICTNSK